jgi:hypothetical protein
MSLADDLEPLLTAPTEALDVEYKSWLDLKGNDEHKAIFAKAAIALANEGGGVIVIGLREQSPALISEPRPATIAPYDLDLINNIIRRFAVPTFHCRLSVARHPDTGHEHTVVRVPGGFGAPVMSKSGTPGNTIRPHLCYVRKPGPESAPPENHADWERLLARCLRNRREDMLNAIRDIVEGRTPTAAPAPGVAKAQETFVAGASKAWDDLVATLPADAAARCPLGRYELDYAILGQFKKPSLGELLEKLRFAVVHRSGWPEFWVPTRSEIEPIPIDDTIQCWLGTPAMGDRDVGHVDFWRASPAGRMFLLRGYIEDEGGYPEHVILPGSIIDIQMPIWRVTECLKHARILGSLLAPNSDFQVCFRAKWYGLAGRRLGSLEPLRSFYLRGHYVTRQNQYEVTTTVGVREITDNLPEIVLPLLSPLYERFHFFKLTMDLVRESLVV